MASKLEISQPAYAKLENGDTRINIKRLDKISDILNIDIIDLLDANTTINHINNNAEHTYGIVETLYTDNKVYVDKIIAQLEKENKRLIEENQYLKKEIKILKNN
jgi:transcriptional regulator with XRE-family HTH domain